MDISNYLRDRIARHTLGLESFSPSNQLYLMLCSEISDNGDTYTELSGTSYARRQLVAGNLGSPSNGEIRNSQVLEFDAAGSTWGQAEFVAVIDSATLGDGNVYFWSALSPVKLIDTSSIFRIRIGDFIIRLTGAFGMRNAILNWLFFGGALSMPSSIIYVGVGNNVGALNASMSEPVAGYGRVAVPAANIDRVDDGEYEIDQECAFAASGADWGEMTHVGIFNAASGGNLFYALQMSPARAIYDGDGIQFNSGAINIQVR